MTGVFQDSTVLVKRYGVMIELMRPGWNGDRSAMVDSNLSEFEDIESVRARISSHMEECRLQGVCPMCEGPCLEGVGTGGLCDGVFCSLECYRAFWDKYNHLFETGEKN